MQIITVLALVLVPLVAAATYETDPQRVVRSAGHAGGGVQVERGRGFGYGGGFGGAQYGPAGRGFNQGRAPGSNFGSPQQNYGGRGSSVANANAQATSNANGRGGNSQASATATANANARNGKK